MANFRMQKRDSSLRRLTLIGMATSREVLEAMDSHYTAELFTTPDSQLIAKWCISYYRKFLKAPGRRLIDRFEQWAEGDVDKKTQEGINTLLTQISKEFESSDYEVAYLIDCAEQYFTRAHQQLLTEALATHPSEEEHSKLLQKHAPVNFQTSNVPVYNFAGYTANMSDELGEALIDLPGDAGRFFGNMLRRGSFIGFQAPEKTGKSFWLMELFVMALKSRKRLKAAYFECGDLMDYEWFDRLASRVSGRPLDRVPDGVEFPRELAPNGTAVKMDVKELKHLSNRKEKQEALAKFEKGRQGRYAFQQFSASQLSTRDLRTKLKRLSFQPDIVFVDYADILNHRIHGEGRDGINGTWIDLRSIAMDMDCCLVTATQADSASYSQTRQTRTNFSDDKRKYSHVAGMVGVNKPRQLNVEHQHDVFLLQWLALRHGRECADLFVGGNLHVSKPMMTSVFARRTTDEDDLMG